MIRYLVSTHDEGRTAPIAIDTLREDGRTSIYGETLEQVEERYPNVKIMTSDEFQTLHEATCCSDPVEITKDKFIEMLEVLPPMKWRSGGGAESFMLSEFTTGRITGIYCRIGKRYYSFLGICTLTHDEIVAKCSEVTRG